MERHHPGFRDLVSFAELSTPLTVEGFTGHRRGGIYGLAATPQRIRDHLVPARTEVDGLFIAGADACSPGVAGALMGGVFAAGAVMGVRGFPSIMGAARREARGRDRLDRLRRDAPAGPPDDGRRHPSGTARNTVAG